MIGIHNVIIESVRLKYEFTLRRNITIIQGDSTTGKTTLIELLRDYRKNGNRGLIQIQSDKTCVVFDGNEENWREQIGLVHDSILFVMERTAKKLLMYFLMR